MQGVYSLLRKILKELKQQSREQKKQTMLLIEIRNELPDPLNNIFINSLEHKEEMERREHEFNKTDERVSTRMERYRHGRV